MINYCTNAMFGGETVTTLVMTVFSAGLIFFIVWVIVDTKEPISKSYPHPRCKMFSREARSVREDSSHGATASRGGNASHENNRNPKGYG